MNLNPVVLNSVGSGKELKRRMILEDELKKQRMKKNAVIKELILKHDRVDILMTEVLGYQIKDFHEALFWHNKNNYKPLENQKWHLALAPRGVGKSTILTVARAILEILKNPNIRILIASKTDDNSVGFLNEIKQKLESKRLIEIFGPQKGTLWNTGEITVKPRTSTAKEYTVHTVGIGGALASKHFDLILADDLVDEENSKTEAQRQKIITWFYKILDPTLEPHGEMSIVGTRYHHDDLYGYLIDRMFTKKNKKGEITKKWYIRIPALIRKKKFPKNAKTHEKYISIWPEKFTVKFLLAKRKSQGTIIFNSQMQNDVEGMKGKIFQADWFQWYKPEEVNIKKLMVFQGVDLAIKQKENADKFAHATIGVDPKTKNIYVLNYFNEVTHYTKQKKTILRKFNGYDPIRVGIEANGYQLALQQDMRDNPEFATIRCVPIYTDTDKTTRAWKLSAYFERGQVFLQEGMNELQEHLLKMPDGRYKDLFDALDIAISLAFGKKKKTRSQEPGIL